jgi:hypothetical protein
VPPKLETGRRRLGRDVSKKASGGADGNQNAVLTAKSTDSDQGRNRAPRGTSQTLLHVSYTLSASTLLELLERTTKGEWHYGRHVESGTRAGYFR